MKQARSSFLKKRTKKLFCAASRGVENARDQGAKVFLVLFLQKKNFLLSSKGF
jgi:hypothetical protein